MAKRSDFVPGPDAEAEMQLAFDGEKGRIFNCFQCSPYLVAQSPRRVKVEIYSPASNLTNILYYCAIPVIPFILFIIVKQMVEDALLRGLRSKRFLDSRK